MEPNRVSGKVALVTGAGSGLGEATARAFAAAGAAVACLDINEENARQVCEEISSDGGRAIAMGVDVSDAGQVKAAVDRTVGELGRLDFAVSCAAIDHTVSVDEMSIAQWDQVIAVNLRGPFLVGKLSLAAMRAQGGGHIVHIASTAATRAWANAAAYHASKWGLIGFGRALGVESRPHNIRVTTIIPGGMKTHFFDRFADQGIPMPEECNLQDPGNVARVILFAVQMPPESVMQEVLVTPLTETSWP